MEGKFIRKLPFVRYQREGAKPDLFVVPDTSEGWVAALRFGVERWFDGHDAEYDFSNLRAAGTVLRTKGGQASGPGPLRYVLDGVRRVILSRQGGSIRPIDGNDIMCILDATSPIGQLLLDKPLPPVPPKAAAPRTAGPGAQTIVAESPPQEEQQHGHEAHSDPSGEGHRREVRPSAGDHRDLGREGGADARRDLRPDADGLRPGGEGREPGQASAGLAREPVSGGADAGQAAAQAARVTDLDTELVDQQEQLALAFDAWEAARWFLRAERWPLEGGEVPIRLPYEDEEDRERRAELLERVRDRLDAWLMYRRMMAERPARPAARGSVRSS